MKIEERKNRILARGEHSNHSHVVVGDAEVIREEKGDTYIKVGEEGAVLKHILETNWLSGQEVWTKEHKDVILDKGIYKYIAQEEYDPFEKRIQQVID